MTREEHIENLKAIASDMPSDKCADWIESLMAGVKALSQEPCGDAISRENTLKAMIEQLGIRNEDYLLPAEATLYKVVKNMPPVTPQPKIGRWIEHFDESGKWYECDQCHTDWGGSVNYCPNCGAKM